MLQGKEQICILTNLEELTPSISRISSIQEANKNEKIQEIEILYEDENIICLEKQRGMHSVLQQFNDPLTVADLLVSYNENCLLAGRDKKEGGLIQRLDFWTSGLMLAAKDRKTWEDLHEEFIKKRVKKTYLALVSKESKNLNELFQDYTKGNLCFDWLEIVSEVSSSALIRVGLSDGSRHVVRKELSRSGFPLVGDEKFGTGNKKFYFENVIDKDPEEGFFLHAESIKIYYPALNRAMLFNDGTKFLLSETGRRLIISCCE